MTLLTPEPADENGLWTSASDLRGPAAFDRKATSRPVDVLAYYYPQWHADPRNDEMLGAGWTEWQLLRTATPRFPGHAQPRKPLIEYDESDPAVAAHAARLAVDAGLRGFVVDWYWYDDGPFLNGYLDRGLLKAELPTDFRFAIMWANHEWDDLFPASQPNLTALLPGPNARPSIKHAFEHLVERYLRHPHYWTVDGRPYFSIYDLPAFVRGAGGVERARHLLDQFRVLAVDAGLPGLHLNGVLTPQVPAAAHTFNLLGLDSATHYTWWHHLGDQARFPTTPWPEFRDSGQHAGWQAQNALDVPFLPHVSVGWDPSPRTTPWALDRDRGYPFTTIVEPPEADQFGEAVREAVRTARMSAAPAVLINAWNEWTEGSYLEPDDRSGDSLLEATQAALNAQPLTKTTSA